MNDFQVNNILPQLKMMFPNYDDEIILSSIFQNEGDYNKIIDSLISFQSDIPSNDSNKVISIFKNVDNVYVNDKKTINNRNKSSSISDKKKM